MVAELADQLHPRVAAWLEIQDPLEQQLAPLGEVAMAALALQPGERVLDVGCGIGRSPFALAQAGGAGGWVVGLDLLEDAILVARQDADLPDNIAFEVGDAERFPFAVASFDAVFSRFGTMFFDDPVAAFRNFRMALRPGGRLGFVCWRGLDENQLDHLPLSAAAPLLPQDLVTQTREAGWFSLSDPKALNQILGDAGFVGIEIKAHDQKVASGSLDAMVDVCVRVGALGAILRDHPHLRPAAALALRQALAERDGPGGPGLRAATWIVTGRTQT
jgi:SAM-dependent methyltransferase